MPEVTGQDSNKESRIENELQQDYEYELIKSLFMFPDKRHLVDIAEATKGSFDNLMCAWLVTTELTDSQAELDEGLLFIFSAMRSLSAGDSYRQLQRFLLNNKDNQDLKTVLNCRRGESSLTMLHIISSMAWARKQYDCAVSLLLEAGADPNIKNDKGRTPLHYATGPYSIAALLEKGADLNEEDNEKKTPLHHVAGVGCSEGVVLLLEKGAISDQGDKQGKTPLQVARDNHHEHIEKYFVTYKREKLGDKLRSIVETKDWFEDGSGYVLTKRQGSLRRKLLDIENNLESDLVVEDLKEFLDDFANDQDLRMVLNFRSNEGELQVHQHARNLDSFARSGTDERAKNQLKFEVKRLLLEADAINLKWLGCSEKEYWSRDLWSNLGPNRQTKLNAFLDKVSKTQNVSELERVVNEAILSGVRFNRRFSQGEERNFTDCVMERIGKLEKNPEVVSRIVCKLVSIGATLYNRDNMKVIDTLEFELLEPALEDHKKNVIKAYLDYLDSTLDFMEVIKGAVIDGMVRNAKIDNTTLYSEYSEDSAGQIKPVKPKRNFLAECTANFIYNFVEKSFLQL
ncbi:ankyrin repeat domain-containing protein [Wolbachia endosymbiont of Diaphorina citri]|uniref:ankyrin repeat domain-containing protein n=1 Tax=Wolbachia endosymbiont of Diaphorina citri TaxID=116598 RepID=UPI00155E8C60|nr:ankyrin repeat domain-containing protein [Wolbachia endosymbiont of Diaphorina citri]QJT94675.1 ankyrin repeat domain-containing protein [Wolbachia endosymbiont of Diaphorina citri]QJT95914.1 ankyrin repeat domain-containing protein [Wolbachia endosymbiont of Diaphorina citri]QJT97276.1 ankyrin repeat domain-containing protein [Wolbachia endosymbiont of Diaphorina citri]QLK11571.1 ankyrin repeat domain-containing protein [Wolbachia endosymbiont of Diaphorina citri]QXY86895.1 ankyrin repeat 